MALFFLVVFLGGAFVVGALVKASGPSRPRTGVPGSEEYDVWGRARRRDDLDTPEEPKALGAARLLP